MIKILKYNAFQKPPVLGFMDIEIPAWNMEIRGIKQMNSNGHEWFAMPSKPYEKDGETKYSPIVKFNSKDVADRFESALKTALHNHLQGG